MSSNFFDQTDGGEFRDIPDEVDGNHAPSVANNVPQRERVKQAIDARLNPQPPEEPDLMEDVYEDIPVDEDDYSAVLSDARLRLEQGRLYEMIMNHDLFAGLDADPNATKHVQRQIRKFAKEQMEIMLGMRRETALVERLEIDFPFNQVEVNVLKMLANTASKGASKNSDNFVPEVRKTTEEIPVVGRKEGLNQIGVKKQENKVAPVKQTASSPAKLPTRRPEPVKRAKLTRTQEQILAEEGVSLGELDQTFDPSYKPLEKPLHEMSPEEIIERNKRISTRRAKSTNSLPMPSAEQESMFHQARVIESAGQTNAVSMIMAAMENTKK